MALSPNYGWAEPDNSSLVKNGAQDIRALGDAIDTSLWNVGFGQAGKNKIINGDFGIWQRGTSFTVTTATFSADRFFHNKDGNGTVTASQQAFTAGSAPVAGYESQYFLQIATSSVGTSTYHQTQQYIEDVRTFAGQTITVSFWAKLSAGTVGSTYFRINQNFGSGGSAQVAGASNTFTPTGSWQRFTATVTLASIAGKTIGTGSQIAFDLVVPFTATNTLQIWGVQVEYGSKATPFETATGTIQQELAACQRYFYRMGGDSVADRAFGAGIMVSTTSANHYIQYPVSMRGVPSASFSAANTFYLYGGGGAAVPSAISAGSITSQSLQAIATRSATTQNLPSFLQAIGSANAFIDISAEL
jgi:hypothetical protein